MGERIKWFIRLLDMVEEARQLTVGEFALRVTLKNALFKHLAAQNERWRQRAGITWIKQGDCNSKFFHLAASARRAYNRINVLRHGDALLHKTEDISKVFVQFYKQALGSPPPQHPPYDLVGKLGPRTHLDPIQEPFTVREIQGVVFSLPTGKASGPDGLPAEFFKHFWQIINKEVVTAILDFSRNALDLWRLNHAIITLIPKQRDASEVGHYRPISVINTMVKIISKLLADRLQPYMDKLVSPLQTAFTKGRSIMESFMVAREIISFYQKRKISAVLYKVDFAKAFDSVSWGFLVNVLVEKGFPPTWIAWILNLLKSSSSSLRINGTISASFMHRKGLRQGDPLSPLLFIIVADALQAFFNNTEPLMVGPVLIPPKTLQFADDTILIMEAHPKNLQIATAVLAHFAQLSGLHINDSKSTFVPVAMQRAAVQRIQNILRCPQSDFPITYLGLPLSVRRPKKAHFIPLVQAIHDRLQGWKAKFLSLDGRLVLIKSVLAAIPLHFMQVIKLPRWLTNHIDKISRSFLWKGRESCLGGHCLVNWERCCLPKRNGGLGILHLSTQNDALLAKWSWKLWTEPTSIWTNTIQTLYGTHDPRHLVGNTTISYGLRDALVLQDLILASLGRSADNSQRIWRWTSDGSYTSKSAYSVMRDSGLRSAHQHRLWKLKVPSKIKIFAWLLLMNRLLTQDNLEKRGWPTIQGCILCTRNEKETIDHLFLHCKFSSDVWECVLGNRSSIQSSERVADFWERNSSLCVDGRQDCVRLATLWSIWKTRNAYVFEGKDPNVVTTMRMSLQDSMLWRAHC